MLRYCLFILGVGYSRFNVTFRADSGDARMDGFVVTSVEDIPLPIEISTADFSVLYLGEMYSNLYDGTGRGVETFNVSLMSEQEDFTFQEDKTRVMESGDLWSNKMVLGVGPSSTLISRTHSIDLVRTSSKSGYLSFTRPLSDFVADCVPNSVITIPFSRRYEYSGTIVGKFRLINSGHFVPISTGRPEPVRVSSPVGLSTGNKILSLPYELVHLIERMLIGAGGARNPTAGLGTYQFTGCPENLDMLPSIALSFFSDNHRSVLGELVLSGPDYIKRSLNGECTFRFRPTGPTVRTLYINPWRLPGVNLRITARETILCDSRHSP